MEFPNFQAQQGVDSVAEPRNDNYALHQDHIYDLRRRPSTASIRLAIPLFDLVPHIDQLHEV